METLFDSDYTYISITRLSEISQLPLLRWKRIAVLAAMGIVVVQGIVFQVAYFLHMQVVYSSQKCS